MQVRTEDDILYIPTLPTFDGTLGQQDSEVLLSYLTVSSQRCRPWFLEVPGSCPWLLIILPYTLPCYPSPSVRQWSAC